MTLMVHAFLPTADGGIEVIDTPPEASDLAGFEEWRTSMWGSERVRSLGARFLPRLADGNLLVEPDEVPEFLAECALLHERAALLTGGGEPSERLAGYVHGIRFRLDNMIGAGHRALRVGGGVIVW
ncbi:hypothetical protein [Streptomyces sp. NPDC051569]|uniref:hypothetical protein n=1 Tax=Streptomyces sp. NPDC051569 TaxID=3365661 RepID=UPI003790B7CC